MIIIGEKLNSSIPKTMAAYAEGNEEYLLELINKMSSCGADYIDVNTALCEDEKEMMKKRQHPALYLMMSYPKSKSNLTE